MANGFTLLAPIYDPLARLVFGQNIDRSQAHFFERVTGVKSALVAGGGTGRFLRDYFQQYPESGLVFVEKSSGMIAKARRRQPPHSRVSFVEDDFLSHDQTGPYDLILLPFFLDMFTDESVERIANSLGQMSNPNTQVIVTDFTDQEKRGWKSTLIRGMYLFFRLTCDIEAHRLPNWPEVFVRNGWNIKQSAAYCSGMIGTHLLARS